MSSPAPSNFSVTASLPPNTPMSSVEALEAECNELGMETLNILEYISGTTIDYRNITKLVQKLSRSMDSILKGVEGLRNINVEGLEEQVQAKRALAAQLQEKLHKYQQQLIQNKN